MPRRSILLSEKSASLLLALARGGHYALHEMAFDASLSRRTFERHILRITGQTAFTWLKRQRLAAARKLLLKASCKVVCFCVGFKHPSQFSREFKERFGFSPSDYRRRRKNLLSRQYKQ